MFKKTEEKYSVLVNTPSDIFEHLPTLRSYASKCESVIEMGVRKCVSSWALALGLLENGSSSKLLIMNDVDVCNTYEIENANKESGLQIQTIWKNNLEIELENDVDLTFIDTWHVYGQLKRELARFAPRTKKYIIMHDTDIDGIRGETLRNIHKYDPEEQSRISGIPVDEILNGLQPAIDEFLSNNSDWVLDEKFTNNYGLTILKRKK
jgi:hypothetical protein